MNAMKTLVLILLALVPASGCCHRMPEPNPIGKSVRVCGDNVQMNTSHGGWYTCEHKAGVCFSRQQWEIIDAWRANGFNFK
jgi:hypothetical protein